jgi:hypothetical protein
VVVVKLTVVVAETVVVAAVVVAAVVVAAVVAAVVAVPVVAVVVAVVLVVTVVAVTGVLVVGAVVGAEVVPQVELSSPTAAIANLLLSSTAALFESASPATRGKGRAGGDLWRCQWPGEGPPGWSNS